MNGHFFVFDGMDGAGKSTAVATLADTLAADGHEVVRTREPGGSPLAEEIRECMLRDRQAEMPVETELLLVFAARSAHLQQTVLPALARGAIVLCDRFVDASHVYQGVLGGADPQWIDTLQAHTVTRPPERTFIFDLPVDQALARIQDRGHHNRFDRAGRERLEAVRQAYRQRAEARPKTHRLIDATADAASVVATLRRLIAECLA